jgi:hypothetical protein
MTALLAYFDGKYLVPEGPVDLPRHKQLRVEVEVLDSAEKGSPGSALDWIGDHAIDDSSLPADLALNHDHYLHGTPKKEQ